MEIKKVIWTIAGSDSSAGAGIQADIKTAQDIGVYCCSVITAITAQSTSKIIDILPINSSAFQKQIDALKYEFKPQDIKTGMIATIEQARIIKNFLNRNPDIFYTKTKEDVKKLRDIQVSLIKAAKNMVKKGGVIVFSTCSLLPQEGADLIESILLEDKALSRSPISAEEFGLIPDIVSEIGDLRTLPFHYSNLGGMDGFYAVRLIRN